MEKSLHDMDFEIDERGFVIVYTDGSCINNGLPGARAGIGVYFGKNHPYNVSKPLVGKPTNNRAEMHAALSAIDTAIELGIKKLCIKTDSEYLVKSMTEWMPDWLANNWLRPNGKDVLNKDDFLQLNKVSEQLTIEWNHVSGHVGIEGNEGADKLAGEATNM